MENKKQTLIERILDQKLQGSRRAISTRPGRATSEDDGCIACVINCGAKPKPDDCSLKLCGGPECHNECVTCEH